MDLCETYSRYALHTTLEMIYFWCRSHSRWLGTNSPILQFSYGTFPERRKWHPLANRVAFDNMFPVNPEQRQGCRSSGHQAVVVVKGQLYAERLGKLSCSSGVTVACATNLVASTLGLMAQEKEI